ncbi:hypothetical protein [Fibrobacter sp.]|uniref:hypothetical protein n=1 Tax=Fibrobacter sp. TaxID=35828 RepID=UPI0025BC4324|nr:hypothetical protein [Fibrobacter sp.]
MKKLMLLAVVGMSAFVACTDENSSNVWTAAPSSSSDADAVESSSSVDAAESSSSSVENIAQSSSSVDNVTESSSSEAGGAQSSSATADTVWHQANLTWYTSWPDPGSEECIEYNGCTWAGYFAGVEGQKSEEWVSQHNIIAVHEKDWDTYKLKTFRLRMNGSTIDAVVYDMCSDSDCDGCCTENAGEIGFLIDIEKYTRERFDGNGDGVVEWTCLDCE